MTHPTERLAPYVDGSLAPAERAEVDAHLATCAVCRADIDLARQARDALRSAPAVPTPDDLGSPALAEMRRKVATAEQGPWTKLTPWLAAAAIIGLLAVALPRIGTGSDDSSGGAREAVGAADVAPRDLRLEIVDQDFDPDSLEVAAAAFVQERQAADDGAVDVPAASATAGAAAEISAVAGKARSNDALTCLNAAFPGFPGTPVRLVKASFDGQPAYLAYVLEGPGVEQPPDTVSIWVASVKGCSVLSITSAAL